MESMFKKSIYIIIFILIAIFFTKDLELFGNDFYKNIKIINSPDDILVLVNKNNKLPANYIPSELLLIDKEYANKNKYLRKEAHDAFINLCKDSSLLGYKIIAVSTYRDFDYQKQLYNNYVKDKGKKHADKSSARPGHSEHQTGLAVDVMGSNNDYDLFLKSKEFNWMKNNAHLYGFILRYPKNKEHITGFKYEPWHYRYVGVHTATYLYNNNLTLEEYKN